MRIVRAVAASISLGLLLGCGGSGSTITPSNVPAFYKGAITVFNVHGILPGTSAIAANVTESNSIQGFIRGSNSQFPYPLWGLLSTRGKQGSLLDAGTQIGGTTSTSLGNDSLSFKLSEAGTTIATGTLTKTPLPTLGGSATVPPQGTYNGDAIQVKNGALVGYGNVTSTVDAVGNWNAPTDMIGAGVSGGVFGGAFSSAGTISQTSIAGNGVVLVQDIPAPYSFDGKTLIVRIDYLAQPGVCWLVMTRQ